MTPQPTLQIPDLIAHLAANDFAGKGGGAPDQVGIEAEFFLLHREHLGTPEAQMRFESEKEIGLSPWLHTVADLEGWERGTGYRDDAPAWINNFGSSITLEPGGQIECSTAPHPDADSALNEIEGFARRMEAHAAEAGLQLLSTGYNNQLGGATPNLVVRKPRYLLMDQHFASIGEYGRMMMRSTCSTQLNLDFGGAEEGMKRWRLANYLAPIVATLFTTTERHHNGICHANFRREIWRRTDPSRTGMPPGMTSSDPITAYATFALDATVIFIDDERAGPRPPAIPTTFRAWLTEPIANQLGGYPDLDDWERHLTTLFPDVRPRGFIEIRTLDALPTDQRRSAVHLLVNALYNEARTTELLAMFDEPAKSAGDPFRLRRSLVGLLEG